MNKEVFECFVTADRHTQRQKQTKNKNEPLPPIRSTRPAILLVRTHAHAECRVVKPTIGEHLSNARRVAVERVWHASAHIDMQRDALRKRAGLVSAGEGECELVQTERDALHVHFPRLNLGEVERVVDDRVHQLHLLFDRLEVTRVLRLQVAQQVVRVRQEVDQTANGVKLNKENKEEA